ncbi:hypothetical protein [Ancylobacter radicis]|uniref:Uncharacterized protein n=1 Tax=Ancylobacter radicis TaxID=2836179 RepID=A0ABS5R3M0_9HYPH|nr:hypothetical protein [Ancylobacter radicis]MBS9476250.1 hypothetical protein [Ancylobacter radicis]
MTDFTITLYRSTDDPPRTVRFDGLDTTGKGLELVIQPKNKMRITLSTADETLAKTDDEDGFVLSYTKDFVAGLPLGLNTTCDVFLVNENETERKLAAGVIKVGGEGEFFDAAEATVYVAGPQGITGASVLKGAGTPSSEAGAVGDIYIDELTLATWGPKTGSGWGGVASGSLLSAFVTAKTATVSVASSVTFVPATHAGKMLLLSSSGETTITLPDDITMAGYGFTVNCASDRYCTFSPASGASLEHPDDHTAGLEKGIAVAHAVLNAAGDHLIWKIAGATQA